MAHNPAFDSDSYGAAPPMAIWRRMFWKLAVVADAAIEVDLCEAVDNDPVNSNRETKAAVAYARGELRRALDRNYAR